MLEELNDFMIAVNDFDVNTDQKGTTDSGEPAVRVIVKNQKEKGKLLFDKVLLQENLNEIAGLVHVIPFVKFINGQWQQDYRHAEFWQKVALLKALGFIQFVGAE